MMNTIFVVGILGVMALTWLAYHFESRMRHYRELYRAEELKNKALESKCELYNITILKNKTLESKCELLRIALDGKAKVEMMEKERENNNE